jgi:hypothetical protein
MGIKSRPHMVDRVPPLHLNHAVRKRRNEDESHNTITKSVRERQTVVKA